jgi:hypothetical protein
MRSEGDPDALKELASIANLITNTRVRRDFDHDPLGTLEREGVNVDALPDPVRNFLADLSYEELRLLAHMQETMVAAGLYVETGYGSLAHL